MLIQKFTFNMFGVNTYIVWDPNTRNAAIIDPGMVDDAERSQIDSFIADNQLHVTHLINTHFHIDHAFGDGYVRTKYGVKVQGHDSDAFLGENTQAQARLFGLDMSSSPVQVEIHLADGDTILIGDEPLKVIHVPGHSPGSIVLYAPQSHFLIAGDVIFKNSIGRTDLAGGNHTDLLNNINRKVLSLPPDTVIYPGHGPSTTVGDEITYNPYL